MKNRRVIEGFPDDSALVRALEAKSPDALGEAYRRYGRAVYGVAHRLTGSRSDAQDVLHDLFVGLPDAVRSFERRGSFEGWLKRIAARMALARTRAQARRAGIPLHSVGVPPGRPETDGTLDRVTLEKALLTLSPSLREVFLLREVEGFTHREVASLLGIEEGASKVRLHRAKRALRDKLRG
ncbi:MAG: RNA polymerase sigma factor [Gemmatimonadota bacterium]